MVLADVWSATEAIIVTVAAAVLLGALALGWRAGGRLLRTLSSVDDFVLPHFAPTPDDHGILSVEHTLPARLERLSDQLVTHMGAEEKLRAEDLDRMDATDAKLDDVLERLAAGNPEMRRAV